MRELQYGVEALLTNSLFSDIAPTLKDERELVKMFRERGALKVLGDAQNSSTQEQKTAIKRAIAKLTTYLQSSREAILLLYSFVEVLGWEVESDPVIQNSEIPAASNLEQENDKPKHQINAKECYEKGNAYYWGREVPQDNRQAVEWYRKSAEQGNPIAQSNLGTMYEHGKGVPQDLIQAIEWYRKASDQGHVRAKEALDRLLNKANIQKRFVCTVCGYLHESDQAPQRCPVCTQPSSYFTEAK